MLPRLENWEETREVLHQVALVASAIRVACTRRMPNDIHFSLDVRGDGFTTSELRMGGELRFSMRSLRFEYVLGGQVVFAVGVEGHSQESLLGALVDRFSGAGVAIEPSDKHISGGERFVINRGMAVDYLIALDAVYTALSRFRARLSGCMSPLVLWAHHFDMAFLWFAGEGMNEKADAQLAFGFAPSSPGLERPYVYAYGWSPAAGYVEVSVEGPARAIREGYTGLYVAWDDLLGEGDFNRAVERILWLYYEAAREKLTPPRSPP